MCVAIRADVHTAVVQTGADDGTLRKMPESAVALHVVGHTDATLVARQAAGDLSCYA